MTKQYIELALHYVLLARAEATRGQQPIAPDDQLAIEARELVEALQQAADSQSPEASMEIVRKLIASKRQQGDTDLGDFSRAERTLSPLDSSLFSAYLELRKAMEIVGEQVRFSSD